MKKIWEKILIPILQNKLESMSLGGEGGGVKGREKGGSQRSEVYGCLVGWCYLPQYFCSILDTNIKYLLHDSMLPPNNINSF